MAQIVKAVLGDGSEVEIETDAAGGIQAVGLGGNALGAIDFGEALKSVRSAATDLAEALRDLPTAPDGYEISFGVKIGGTVGVIIAKAQGEANFAVKLSWKKGG